MTNSVNMLTQFLRLRDGYLGLIKVAQHQIALEKKDSRPIQSATYRAGSKEREFEMQEIYAMLVMNFIERCKRKWACLADCVYP